MKKRLTHKTLGWVLLGTGAALFGTAYLMNVADGWNAVKPKGENLVIAGITTAALSPAFFILTSINKSKAYS